ncbi:MAG: DNA polymerase/3'-5' exonuclease PolX [Phycisphaerales bacterium]|nr:MAG: DNA polymerase/3'-5' exonuclease PolX [Phycisphaerales bacterium]
MISAELARAFERIADLLEIDGADRFRINSYRRASRTLDDTSEDLAELAAQGSLTSLPGIGKGTAQRIQQYIDTGHIDVLDELEARLPDGLPGLLQIPGLGPKKVALVYEKLNVTGIDALREVIDSGELAALPGFGAASVQKIADGIAFLESSSGRTPLGIALPIAEDIAERVGKLKGVKQVEIAGSLRRGAETIGDIDILCTASNGKRIIDQFSAFDGVKRILTQGATKGSVTVEIDRRSELQIDLRVVPRDSFGAALQYFTGSKEHNVRLREIAVRKKWRLNEYGLFDGDTCIAGRREEDIYKKLGLPCVPPELREDRGEFEPDARFDDLVTLKDIRGDLHMHTTASDGRCTIEEMALAAKARGYQYIAICDHSKSATIANGLSIARMEKHIAAVKAANDKIAGITILAGTEVDILPDGTLDYPEDLLAKCDWVVASIHLAMGKSASRKMSPTQRTLAAMENRYVSMIGHPTGRLINTREPMDLDMAAVVEAAARTKTMLEISAGWQRLDLKDTHIRQAIAAGVTVGINTDGHHTGSLDQTRFGVTTARRGGATKKDVINCCTLATLRKRIGRKQN